MKKFYCNGKKDFCDRNLDCDAHDELTKCVFFDDTGGEYVEEDEEEVNE